MHHLGRSTEERTRSETAVKFYELWDNLPLSDSDTQVWVLKCAVDSADLRVSDMQGKWKPFDQIAREGIGAVSSFGLGALDFLSALRAGRSKSLTKANALLRKAVSEQTNAVLVWRDFIQQMNSFLIAHGLPPLHTTVKG